MPTTGYFSKYPYDGNLMIDDEMRARREADFLARLDAEKFVDEGDVIVAAYQWKKDRSDESWEGAKRGWCILSTILAAHRLLSPDEFLKWLANLPLGRDSR